MDPTETIRREAEINSNQSDRERLEEAHGKGNVWDSTELAETFEVIGFGAPFCVVRRKADGVKGSVEFQHRPRFYYNFIKD